MKSKSTTFSIVFLLSLFGVVSVVRATKESLVTVNNYGYDNIVVAISPDVKDDNAEVIIKNLQNLIRDASSVLYKATAKRFYYKSVNILIPESWTRIPANDSLWETYDTSDIRVAPGNWEFKDRPFTVHAGGCGQPGEYINLTPIYLAKLNDPKMHNMYGPPPKIFVQEWAKYRYGVFEENGHYWDHHVRPHFYKSHLTGEIVPNLCASRQPEFTTRDITTNGTCKIDPLTGVYDRNCDFQLNPNSLADFSLMSYHPQALKSSTEFCDSDRHDATAPTKHNFVCGPHSIWSILRTHPDFKNNGRPPTSIPNTVFNVVQVARPRYVLVMDVSGSMDLNNRLGRMIESTKLWIENDIPLGSSVGIVKFSTEASILHDIMKISGQESRNRLTKSLPTVTEGSTCIGCGLQKAVNMLRNSLENKGGGVIILITDGEENERPSINDVTAQIEVAKMRVVSVAFGTKAEDKIEDLSDASGGKSYFIHDETSMNNNNQDLSNALQGCLTYQPAVRTSEYVVELLDEVYFMTGLATGTFRVDSTVGKKFQFKIIFMPSYIQPISTFSLKSPSGQTFDITQLRFDGGGYAVLELLQAQPGVWRFSINFKFSSGGKAKVVVTAQTNENKAPLRTECYFREPNHGRGGLKLIAAVTHGSYPVIGIKSVRAKITPPDPSKGVVRQLKDNGIMGDEEANDGIYTYSEVNLPMKGRYVLACEVDDDGSSYIKDGFVDMSRRDSRLVSSSRIETNATQPGPFTRKANAGSFKVTLEMLDQLERLPPGRVTDFRLVDLDYASSQFTVQFTAPGSREFDGTVSSYEMLYASSYDVFVGKLNNLTNTKSLDTDVDFVTSNMMVTGNVLTPKPAGETQMATIEVDRNGISTFYIAVRGISGSQVGEWSNIATVIFVDQRDATGDSTTVPAASSATSSGSSSNAPTSPISPITPSTPQTNKPASTQSTPQANSPTTTRQSTQSTKPITTAQSAQSTKQITTTKSPSTVTPSSSSTALPGRVTTPKNVASTVTGKQSLGIIILGLLLCLNMMLKQHF